MSDNVFIKSYLEDKSPYIFLNSSRFGGRGVFASSDLPEHTVIFSDLPLVLGPRADGKCPLVCVKCHRVRNLKLCPLQCGLPLCVEECNGLHHMECATFRKLNEGLELRKRMAMVAPIRSIALTHQERMLLNTLECHERADHETALSQMKEVGIPEEDERIIRKCYQVLDATGYESPCEGGSLRGIYPIAALMNHCCVPNTRHSFDNAGTMIVQTTKFVKKGQELTTTYTNLAWGTQARRTHLQVTKKFLCKCDRCGDPTEFGSKLMSLYCMKRGCNGVILPTEGIRPEMWQCNTCLKKISSMRIDIIQNMIGSTLSKVDMSNIVEACRMLCKKVLCPGSNYLAVEFKFSLIRIYGNRKGFKNEELTEEDVKLKLLLCVEMLTLLSLLRLGSCRERGHVLVELLKTLLEIKRRNSKLLTSGPWNLPYDGNILKIYEEAKSILHFDNLSQKTLQNLLIKIMV